MTNIFKMIILQLTQYANTHLSTVLIQVIITSLNIISFIPKIHRITAKALPIREVGKLYYFKYLFKDIFFNQTAIPTPVDD
jgi:hypothetical protein